MDDNFPSTSSNPNFEIFFDALPMPTSNVTRGGFAEYRDESPTWAVRPTSVGEHLFLF
jgi:hypothetical protein